MKKVLIIIRSLAHGGAEKSLVSFLNTVDKEILHDNEITVDLLLTQRNQFFEYQLPDYVNVIECPFDYAAYCNSLKSLMNDKNRFSLGCFLRKVYSCLVKKTLGKYTELASGEIQWKYVGRTLKRFPDEYDVAMAYFHDASAYYLIDKIEAKKKIIWIHNEYGKLGYNDEFERGYYSRADKIITISDRCVESFTKHFPELRNKVEMIENISSRVLINKMAGNQIPEEFKKETVNILSVGRLCEQKGYDIGIEAFRHIQNIEVPYHWYIMGAGEKEIELKARISKYGLQNRITLLGLRSNPYPYIKYCNIFFQPSRYEGKSIALDEAMILERPIVVTAYDTAMDSIKDGLNGKICGMSSEEVVEGLSELIANVQLREKYAAQLHIEKHGNENEIEKYYELMR